MAKSSGLGMQCYVHGYDLSGDVGAIDSISTPRGVLEVPGIDKSAMERILSHTDAQAAFTAFFNDAAGQEHAALSGLPTTDRVLVMAKSSTRGASAFGMVGKQINYDPTRGPDGSLTLDVSAMGSTGTAPGWGEMLSAGKETFSSSGSKASYDGGASSSNGIGIWAHAFSLGSGTPTLLVEDSSDDAIWATLATLTINGANEAEYVAVSGSVDRYLRITTTGTFTDFAVAVMARRFTANDIEAAA